MFSASAPPDAVETVATELSDEPLIQPGGVKLDATLEADLFVTIYSSITILLSVKALPITPSPK